MGKLVLMNGIYYMQDSISGELTPIDRIPDQEINSATPETKGGVVIADNLDEDESNPLAVPNAQLVKTLLTDLKTSLNTEFDSKLEEKLNTEEFASRFSEALAQSDINVDQLKGLIKLANLPATSIPNRVDVTSDASRLALTTEQVQLGDHVYVIDTKKYYVVVDDTKLNTKEGYLEYNASVEWSSILNIPTEFKPESHTHQLSDVIGAQSTINTLIETVRNTYATKTSVSDLSNSVSNLSTEVTEFKNDQTAKNSEVEDSISQLESSVSDLTTSKDELENKDVELETKITNVSDKTNQLETGLDGVKSNIETHGNNISTLETSVSTLENKTSNLETSVSNLETSVSTLGISVTNLEEKTETLNEKIGQNTSGIQGLSDSLDNYALKTEVSSQISDVSENLTEAINNVNSSVNTNAQSISTLSETLTNLANEVSANAENITTNLQSIHTNSSSIQENNQKIETINQNLEGITSRLDTTDSNVSQAQSTADTANTKADTNAESITANASKISALEDRASALESQTSDLGTSVSTLESRTTNLETTKINISDLSGLVAIKGTNVSPAKHEIVTKKNNKNLTAKIWNESSGGGLQFINEDANIISFLGINNGSGDSDIWAQFYAKYIDNNGDQIKNKGTRVNFTNHGIYMTMDRTNSSYTENDLLVTKNDLNSLVSQDALQSTLQETKKEITEAFENVSDSIEDVNNASDSVRLSLSDRISLLERKLQDMKATNVATSNLNEDVSDTNVDIVSNGSSVHSVIRNVTAKSISLTNANVDSGRFNLKADDDISIKNLNTSGNLAKVVSNAGVSINTNGYVTINDSNYSQIGYNGIEIGLSNTAPKSVLIDNIDFTANMSNNAILVFATQDNAVITISNCHFASVSDMLRISNRTNATGVVINIINCVIDKTDDNPQWGLILCEDYMKGTHDEVVERNLFSSDKITINIINTYMNGKKITENIINSTSEPSVITVFNDYEKSTDREKAVASSVEASDTTRYPKVVIS